MDIVLTSCLFYLHEHLSPTYMCHLFPTHSTSYTPCDKSTAFFKTPDEVFTRSDVVATREWWHQQFHFYMLDMLVDYELNILQCIFVEFFMHVHIFLQLHVKERREDLFVYSTSISMIHASVDWSRHRTNLLAPHNIRDKRRPQWLGIFVADLPRSGIRPRSAYGA